MRIVKIGKIIPLTEKLGNCLLKHFPTAKVFCVEDIPGEDHVYAQNENNIPMFDMIITTGRKFAFIWYYHDLYRKGIEMVEEMKDIAINEKKDFIIKFPNFPKKRPDIHTTIRWGEKAGGKKNLMLLKKIMIKKGNPQLEATIHSRNLLATYRNFKWTEVPNALDLILAKAKSMAMERLKTKKERIPEIRGYFLYAGCGYSYVFPELGFGMRDIDVNLLFTPKYKVGSICTFTENCGIKEFGKPEYCEGKTRWLDLMWNNLDNDSGDVNADMLELLARMRFTSDRWATMSQRPMINLETKEIIYKPNWLNKIKAFI